MAPWDGDVTKYEPITKPDVFSPEGLRDWLAHKPADQRYDYFCNGACLLAQYFSEHGFRNITMWSDSFWHGDDKCPRDWNNEIAQRAGRATMLPECFNSIARDGEKSFGAALLRTEQAIHQRREG